MKRHLQAVAFVLTTSVVVAGIQHPARAIGVSGGDIPVPAKLVAGTYQSNWDGAYSDLLAADALAACWTTQRATAAAGPSWGEGDTFIVNLLAKMTSASCHTTCSNTAYTLSEDVTVCAYMDSRKDAACNMDVATRQAKALDVSKLRNSVETQDYVLPTATAMGLSGTAVTAAIRNAQMELSYAELNLCMAEQLNQKLDTAQVAFASNDDLGRVQDAVRERALTAVYEYAVLGKTFASSTAISTAINGADWYLLPLAQWKNGTMTSSNAIRIGDDFAQAVKLLVESTEASINFQLRAPEAQSSFGVPNFPNGIQFVGMTGPRQDILSRILYDGKSDYNALKRSAVVTDIGAPQVGVLLGLARSADALKLHVSGNPQFISAANAATLMLAVENFLRNDDCTRHGVPPASCAQATGTTAPSAYLLWQRYGVTMSHAQTLVDALTEAMFGPPTPASRLTGSWAYDDLFSRGVSEPTRPAEQLTSHFLGTMQFTGSLTTAFPVGDVVIPSSFSVAPVDATDIQSMRPYATLPLRDVNPNGLARQEIGLFRESITDWIHTINGLPTFQRRLGSNSVLALARESLLQLAQAALVPRGIYTEAAPALGLIEKMIGIRQVTIRESKPSFLYGTASSCATCFVRYYDGSFTIPFTVDILTKSTDPYNQVAIVPGIPLAATLARDASTRTVFGATQASALATLTYSTPPATTLTSGYVQRTASGSWTSPGQITVMLKSTTGGTSYQHAFTGGFHDLPDPDYWDLGRAGNGTVVTFGGRFQEEVTSAWAFDPQRWSSPKFDGFGLPRGWTPAADASLFGVSGVPVERYFLDQAQVAAGESATALQQAFDTLQQQALDDAASLSSDARSQQLTSLEYQALCGANTPTCSPSYILTSPVVPACAGPTNADCESFRATLGKIIGNPIGGPTPNGIPLASAVVAELNAGNPAPTFGTYKGGSLQGLFLSQWNSWQGLNAAMSSAIANVQSALAQVALANAEATVAVADYNAVNADVQAMYAQVSAQNAMFVAQQAQYNAQKTAYDAQMTAAQTTMNQDCSQDTFNYAIVSGKSFSRGGNLTPDAAGDAMGGWRYHVSDLDNSSWSPGPLIAAVAKCQASQTAYNAARTSGEAQKSAMDTLVKALMAQAGLLGLQQNAQAARLDAAEAHKEIAYGRVSAAIQAVAGQEAGAAQTVQTAMGQVLTSFAAINQAYTQADLAAAKTAIDLQQANYDIRTRFGLRTRYHSYDLWRARALTENARRLALAARRAIESRYVVDLSTMTSEEPFVNSPSVWADQIYAPDLKPFSIGLSPVPTATSGLYTSAVKDYVGNLALFLDGFAVQRPSAAVVSDAEVIQIPAPAAQVSTSVYNSPINYIDMASAGWSFYCPNTATWIADPDVAKFMTTTPVWTLSTACGGGPPTRARFTFSLDPWGRPQGSITSPPYASRYNVRTGALALNLVGSGIRSCASAPDPAACYAEPFIRYDLKHVGPAWVTNYDGEWRALEIPRAVIEAGKALATEEWLDPVSNGFNRPDVTNVLRREFEGRPTGGAYELTLYLTPDVRVERISRIQLLAQMGYWVRQQ